MENSDTPDAPEVYDLFCGAGGFSEGARAAGYHVALACDSDEAALATHRRNHPTATHRCCSLPCDLPLPTDGRPFHLHGSPPCQQFSKMNQKGRSETAVTAASKLVEWFVNFAMGSRATSWSMEQVAQPRVMRALERLRSEHRNKFNYAVVNMEKLGVPQTRIRVIAGSPHLVARLLRATEEQPRRSIQAAISKPRGTHIRGTATGRSVAGVTKDRGTYRWSDLCRPLTMPAPTVVGRHALTWITGKGEKCNRAVLDPSELAALQTFPPGYKFPLNKKCAYSQIGSAVPPRVAQLMLQDVH